MIDQEHRDRRTREQIPYTVETCAQLGQLVNNGTLWSTRAQFGELHDTSVPSILRTIRRVFADGGVGEETDNSELGVQQEGERQVCLDVKAHNFEIILAIGDPFADSRTRCLEGSGASRRASRSPSAGESRARRDNQNEQGTDDASKPE